MAKSKLVFTEDALEKALTKILDERFKAILDDISYRISVYYDTGVGARMAAHNLNISQHILDGYTFTDNSPNPGYVAWADCKIVYKGITYNITNGNTNKKYIWWDYDASPNTVFQTSDTKPTMTDDDVLVAINENGTHRVMIGTGRMLSGAALLDGTVSTNELGANAVTSEKLAALSVLESHLGAGAVTGAKIADGAVADTKIASNAVTAAKIASGAVDGTKIASGAVGTTHLVDNAITTAKIAASAVNGTKIATGAVGTTQLADNSITTAKVQAGAIGTSQLADSAVTGIKIGAGAVATEKLNIATHLLF